MKNKIIHMLFFVLFLFALNGCDFFSNTTSIEVTSNTDEITQLPSYYITFNSNGGETISDITGISFGSTIDLPIPERTGYIFKGWYLGESINAEHIYNTTPIVENMTLYARWALETYTVKFYCENSLIYVEYVDYGSSANAPIPTFKEGYSFIEWDKSFVEVCEDMSIYAQYQINYYDISFDPNGGTYVNDIDNIQYNTSTELPVPKREGYDFLGWISDDIVYNSHSKIKSNLYLVARWAETAYLEFEFNSEKLTYDVSGYYGTQEHVIIPETYKGYNVTNIQNSVFCEKQNIVSIFIPKTLESIDDYAITLNDNIEEIIVDPENRYFESIEGLLYSEDLSSLYVYPAQKTDDTFIFPDELIKAMDCVFYSNTYLKHIYMHKDVSYYGENWFMHTLSLESITVDLDNPNFTSIDGVLFNKDLSIILQYPANKSGIHYDIPATVEIISENAFRSNINLQTVNIPEGVIEIKSFSFHYANLLCFELPDSLTTIGYSAFGYNPNIISLTLPKNVFSIDRHAFEKNYSLVEILVDEENQYFSSIDGILYNYDKTLLHTYPNGKKGELYLIPNSVVEVKPGAIFDNSYLKYIYIPNSVLYIPTNAFCGGRLTILTEFFEPQENWSIAWNSRLHLDLENIDSTSDLDLYPVIYNISEIGTYEDFNYFLKPDRTVAIIGQNIDSLNTNLVIPETINSYPVNEIRPYAFYNIQTVSTIDVPDTIDIIGEYAFADSNITVNLVDYEVQPGWLDYWDHNVNINWGDEIRTITFDSNGGDAVEPMNVIFGTEITELPVPTRVGYTFVGWYLNEIEINPPFTYDTHEDYTFYAEWIDAIDNGEFLYRVQTDDTVIIVGISESNVNTAIVIPNTIDTYPVTVIGKRAFEDNTDITSITIPASVIEIEYNAFKGMSWLETVTFEAGSNLEIIGDYAFKSCSSLTSIDIPEGVVEIGAYAFSYVYTLNTITLPSTLTTIGNNAFEETWSLSSITIPLAVTNMSSNVFLGSSVPEINCECSFLQHQEWEWAVDWNPDLITVNWG